MEEGEERGAKGSRLLCSRTLKYAIGRLYTRVACHHTLSPASFNVVAHVEWKAKKKKRILLTSDTDIIFTRCSKKGRMISDLSSCMQNFLVKKYLLHISGTKRICV